MIILIGADPQQHLLLLRSSLHAPDPVLQIVSPETTCVLLGHLMSTLVQALVRVSPDDVGGASNVVVPSRTIIGLLIQPRVIDCAKGRINGAIGLSKYTLLLHLEQVFPYHPLKRSNTPGPIHCIHGGILISWHRTVQIVRVRVGLVEDVWIVGHIILLVIAKLYVVPLWVLQHICCIVVEFLVSLQRPEPEQIIIDIV